MIDRGNALPSAALARAVQLLRESPEPSDIWRRRLLGVVRDMPQPGRVEIAPSRGAQPRRFVMHPAAAIAAGLLCAFVGGATVLVIARQGQPIRSSAPAVADAISRPRVRFTLDAPNATRVSIVGDFNGWNPTSLPLRRSSDGRTWEVEVPLAPGRYAYSFMVDGALAPDPTAPRGSDDDFGTPNSVLMVKGS